MNYNYGTKKPTADKIALLGLFVLSLAAGRVLVAWKSAIILSEPIALEHSGLSVSAPLGNGWRSKKSWSYLENNFTLRSFFAPDPSMISVQVLCRYMPAGPTESPEARFGFKASEITGKITETGQISQGSITVEWVYIETEPPKSNIIFGIASLPQGRQLNIEVEHIAAESDTAFKAFEKVVLNINFEDNRFLAGGGRVVADLKKTLFQTFRNNNYRKDLFLISDMSQRPIGFTTEMLVDSGDDGENIKGASFLYVRGQRSREQVTYFQCDRNLDEFVWKSRTLGRRRLQSCEMTLRKDRTLTIRRFVPQARESIWHLSSAAVPEIFLEFVLAKMIDSGYEKIVLDVIEADGKIRPMFFSASAAGGREESGQAEFVITASLMHESKVFEKIYFDKNRRMLKRVAQPEGIYTFERSSEQDLLIFFPEKAEYILHRNKLFEQDQL